MMRREFITLIAGAIVTTSFAARAQQVGRTYRLGCLLPLTRDAPTNVAFFDELRRLGFIEGQNLRSNIAHMDSTSIWFRNMLRNLSMHGSMSSQPLGRKQLAPFSRRQKPFQSSRSEAIC